MAIPETAHDILTTAIDALDREVGLRLDVIEHGVGEGDKHVDALIQMPDNGTRFAVEIKKWAAQANLGALINQMRQLAKPEKALFVADYINANMGERLKEAGIQYLDAVGNAYIQQPPIVIYIKGNKPKETVRKDRDKTGRAFQPTGMKVVLAFLKDEALINAPYREIADQAGVALGTVGWVIGDLVAQGFILEGTNKNKRTLADFDRLLDKWVEEYPHKLKNKHTLGVFTTDNPGWWKNVDLKKTGAQWGGEIAAAKYTKYLNPKNGVVYVKKVNMAKFLKAARLRKPERHERTDIEIHVIEPFWTQETPAKKGRKAELAHPIVTYADLIETGDTRNLDTANRLREKFLR